jgi:hypothetical protein
MSTFYIYYNNNTLEVNFCNTPRFYYVAQYIYLHLGLSGGRVFIIYLNAPFQLISYKLQVGKRGGGDVKARAYAIKLLAWLIHVRLW